MEKCALRKGLRERIDLTRFADALALGKQLPLVELITLIMEIGQEDDLGELVEEYAFEARILRLKNIKLAEANALLTEQQTLLTDELERVRAYVKELERRLAPQIVPEDAERAVSVISEWEDEPPTRIVETVKEEVDDEDRATLLYSERPAIPPPAPPEAESDPLVTVDADPRSDVSNNAERASPESAGDPSSDDEEALSGERTTILGIPGERTIRKKPIPTCVGVPNPLFIDDPLSRFANAVIVRRGGT